MKPILKGILAGAAALVATAGVASAQTKTLDTVKQRGTLSCGVNIGLAGFSQPDDKGNWTGLDVDYCKAIAAAVFGDATKVKYVPTTAKERFTALQSGEIDVLIRNTTWTTARDSSLGLIFAGVNYYDGQGFMVKASLGVKSAKELNGATVCVQTGTTTELNLADYFKANKMTYKPVVFEKLDETLQAYLAGRCDVYTTDQSGLYSVRVQQPKPEDHLVLPEIISKEPLGVSVRQGDDQWLTVVKWVHFALLNAEEAGITQANLAEMVNSTNPEIKRIVGKDGEIGKGLGLPNDFVVSIVKAVGNYGELFERNVGSGSRLKIARGLNNLWNNGGLQYAPPLR
jgi:general L-amino acid transport system substrate-binding protein